MPGPLPLLSTGNRHPADPSLRLSVAAAVVGFATALALFAFRHVVGAIQAGTDALLPGAPPGLVALVPAVGGALAGLAVVLWVGPERHPGVGGILEALALRAGRLRHRAVPGKALGAAVALGSGVSVGPEDPSVQIGTGLGSLLATRLRLSDDRVRALVVAGATAAISSAFRAPIAGVFFAIEVMLGEVAGGTVGAALVASVASFVGTQALTGGGPTLAVPAYEAGPAWHVAVHAALGAVAGLVAAGYGAAIEAVRGAARRVRVALPVKTAVAGLAIGAIGLALPDVLGVGYGVTGRILTGAGPAPLVLVALVLAKPLATALAVGAGVPGGVFAPALVTGACLGAAAGAGLDALFPSAGFAPVPFAMVGMGAVLAGAVHAPLTAAMLLFEVTDDWHVVAPAFVAVAVAHGVSRRVRRESVYTASLAREGIRLERGRVTDVLESIAVREVMEERPPTVPGTVTAADAFEALERARRHGLVVVDREGRLVGVVTLADLDRAAEGPQGLLAPVSRCCTTDVVVAFPDESLADALARMAPRDLGRLPVVARDDPRRLVGLLRRTDVVRAYDAAARRRAATSP